MRTPAELIAEPLTRFVVLASPPAPVAADTSLTFTAEPLRAVEGAGPRCCVLHAAEGEPALAAAEATGVAAARRAGRRWPSVARWHGANAARSALDWNHDFRSDIAV